MDYFSGANEGAKNLINALDSYTQEEQNRPTRALQLKLLQQRVQEGDLTLSDAQAKRQALADIMKAYSDKEKTPTTTRLDTVDNPNFNPANFYSKDQPSINPLDAVGNLNNSLNTPTMQREINVPAVNYTPQEQNQRALGIALKSGQPDAVNAVDHMVDITNKIDPSKSNIIYESTKRASDVFKMTGDANAANSAYKQYLIEHGATEEQAGTLNFNAGGNVVTKDMPDGSKVITVHPGGGQPPKIFYDKGAKDKSKLLTPEEETQQIRIAQAKRESNKFLSPDVEAQQVRIAQAKRKPTGDDKPSDTRAGIKTMADAEAKILSAPDAPETAAYAEAYNAMSKTNEYVRKTVTEPGKIYGTNEVPKWVKQPKSAGGTTTTTAPQKDKFGYTVGEVQKGHKYLGNDKWQKL